jgi:hypothetical protein
MLRFENGGVITVMYDYPYSDPTEGTPFWTLDFHTPEYMAEDAEFRHHVEEVCTESQRVEIQPYKETPAPRPDIRQIRHYAWRTMAALLVLCFIIQQVQLSSQPPTWRYSLPICWFVAGLYYIGIPLLGTLLFFAFKGMGMRCRIPMGLTIIAGHMLAGHMEQFDTQIQFTTTMGSGAYGISLFAFVYYILVLLPGLCLCLFIHGAWKSALNRLGKIAEVLIYLLLSCSLLWLCCILILRHLLIHRWLSLMCIMIICIMSLLMYRSCRLYRLLWLCSILVLRTLLRLLLSLVRLIVSKRSIC